MTLYKWRSAHQGRVHIIDPVTGLTICGKERNETSVSRNEVGETPPPKMLPCSNCDGTQRARLREYARTPRVQHRVDTVEAPVECVVDARLVRKKYSPADKKAARLWARVRLHQRHGVTVPKLPSNDLLHELLHRYEPMATLAPGQCKAAIALCVSWRMANPKPQGHRERAKRSAARHPVYNRPLHPFYDSRRWKELRVDVLARDGCRCVLCGATALDGVRLHVDHIKPRSLHPELEWEPSNLQVLCEPCNLGKSNRYQQDWRGPYGAHPVHQA